MTGSKDQNSAVTHWSIFVRSKGHASFTINYHYKDAEAQYINNKDPF